MKKLIIFLAIGTTLLHAQTLPVQENTEIDTATTLIEDFTEEYQKEVQTILIEEFINSVLIPTSEAILDNVNTRLEQNHIDLLEAQSLLEELDSTLLDDTLDSLINTTAQNLAKELQVIIQNTMLESIENTINSFYTTDDNSTLPQEIQKAEETTEIQTIVDDTKIEPSTAIVSEVENIDKEEIEPFISPAPEKIDYIASPTVKKTTTPVISQTINLTVGDYHDIILNGEGWIYLGEIEEKKTPVISFYNRYMDGIDSYFGFDAINPGFTTLHFYKQDIIGRTYLDEYIKIIVKPEQKTYYNSYNNYNNKNEESLGISAEPEVSLSGGGSSTVINDTSSMDYVFVPETILDEAQEAFDNKDYELSIALLDEYTSMGTKEIDRALFLYAKNYESHSEFRNVKLAYSYYSKIISTFPDSTYIAESEKRVVYLERFYLIG